ncbi:MBL fold metallo-hydrolase [Streptomyces sp. URMC 129]|uniref:MBL fold metallo-hydrolase n=1 Tax=Streptomyces sp. URMC 129 TaxID=3423407 RepID=UPI003F1BDEF7
MGAPTVTQVADGTYLVGGTEVNWTVLTDGDAVTLIDAGYPGDEHLVVESLRSLGYRPEQIAAVLITHAHIDHVGSLPGLLRRGTFPVHTSEQEARHARREYLEQATTLDVVTRLWRPGYLGWSLAITRAGATKHVRVPEARPFPGPGPLDLPGHPVPVPTPGHTSGHTCYHLPEAGALVTGDTLITGHRTSPVSGPQLVTPFFSHDPAATLASLDVLEPLAADVILPGHGPAHRGPLKEATALARERAAATR